jgi:hypothetical protein
MATLTPNESFDITCGGVLLALNPVRREGHQPVTPVDRSGMRCPRAAARHFRSRAARASACRHYDRRARCIAGTAVKRRRRTRPVTSAARSLARVAPWDDDSLWQEPWWNADRRAPFAKGELYRKVQRIRISVVRRSAFLIFLRIHFFLRFHSWLEALIVTALAPTACAF